MRCNFVERKVYKDDATGYWVKEGEVQFRNPLATEVPFYLSQGFDAYMRDGALYTEEVGSEADLEDWLSFNYTVPQVEAPVIGFDEFAPYVLEVGYKPALSSLEDFMAKFHLVQGTATNHMDLHTGNVRRLSDGGLALIDWELAKIGHPLLDKACALYHVHRQGIADDHGLSGEFTGRGRDVLRVALMYNVLFRVATRYTFYGLDEAIKYYDEHKFMFE